MGISAKRWWQVLALAICLSGCARSSGPTLYQRLGGAPGVDDIVYRMLVNISRDERVLDRFKGVDISRFRAGFARYICSVSGGGCVYEGDSMREIHAGHQYTATEFNAIVDNLIRAMEAERVPTRAQNALLAELAPTYEDVVYH